MKKYEINANKTACKLVISLVVSDAPEFDLDELHKFTNPVVVKAGQTASFKMMFPPQDSLEIRWFKDTHELMDGGEVKVTKEPNHSRLQIKDCLESDAGEIKIQIKNLYGAVEALSRLIVLGKVFFFWSQTLFFFGFYCITNILKNTYLLPPPGKPSPPKGPVEVLESTDSVIELKWTPPSNDGGSAVTNYIIERQQAGQSLWKRLGDVSADTLTFRDRNVSHGKRYIYRIYAENPEGIGDPLETDNIMAGTLSKRL